MKQEILVKRWRYAISPASCGTERCGCRLRVADAEEYRLRLTDAEDLATARKAGRRGAPHIPNGRVVRGDADVNVGYSWHIDPASVEFADTTTEV